MLREDRTGFPDTDFPADGVDTIAKAGMWARERYASLEALVDDEHRLTFEQYVDAARGVAKGLLAAGIEIGDRVAVWAQNSTDFAVVVLGIHLSGGVLVPVNTRFKGPEVDFVLKQSRIKVAFSVEEFLGTRYADVLAGLWSDADRPQIVTLDTDGDGSLAALVAAGQAIGDAQLDARIADIDGEAIATILFTSGTTGRPKGAMLKHAALVRAYWAWSGAAGMREGDRFLCSNPFFHAFGLKVGLLSALLRGVAIRPLAVFDAELALELIERERITYYPGPPTIFQAMLSSPDLDKRDISTLRGSVIGSTALPPALIRSMYERLGFEEIHSPYGFTEGTGVATITIASDDRELVATTAGVPLPGIDVRIVRADGTDADPGEVGEVVVSGYNRMAGYLDPETGHAASGSTSGALFSGDLGEMDEQGYLRIRGRIKDMYIVGGFNVYPAEIEACLQEMDAVQAAAVVGMPDERLGEVGCAFVVVEPGRSLTHQEVAEWCRERLANFKVPRAVVLVDALPLNATGKVAKAELVHLLPSQPD